jgi:hypothetical protein
MKKSKSSSVLDILGGVSGRLTRKKNENQLTCVMNVVDGESVCWDSGEDIKYEEEMGGYTDSDDGDGDREMEEKGGNAENDCH